MEEIKYYTPDKEDIRIGYECELYFGNLVNEQLYPPFYGPIDFIWNKSNIDELKIKDYVNEDIKNADWVYGKLSNNTVHRITSDWYNCKSIIRTPYLTKEQIEAEGWDFGNVCILLVNFTAEEEDEVIRIGRKGDYKLGYNFFTNMLKIVKHEEKEPVLYSGKCLSINEFRTILKLLGI